MKRRLDITKLKTQHSQYIRQAAVVQWGRGEHRDAEDQLHPGASQTTPKAVKRIRQQSCIINALQASKSRRALSVCSQHRRLCSRLQTASLSIVREQLKTLRGPAGSHAIKSRSDHDSSASSSSRTSVLTEFWKIHGLRASLSTDGASLDGHASIKEAPEAAERDR